MGLIKIFTGGGIYSISEMLEPMRKVIYEGDEKTHLQKFRELEKEINKQRRIVSFTEKFWGVSLKVAFSLFDGKTLSAGEEFDLHSLFVRRSLSIPH